MNLRPLLNMLDANPLTSPVIPPPIAINASCLENFLLSKIYKILLTFTIFLFCSVGLKV